MENQVLDYALRYAAELGWYVLPVHRDSKMPATKHGVKDASIDEQVIRFWFKRGDKNIGIAAGKSGFSLLDVDPRNGGDDSLAGLIKEHGPLPETVCQLTGGGGEHYLFKVPEGMRIKNGLGAGLDGINEGKYFIAEPSIHAITKDQYGWEGSSDPFEGQSIADAPQWMIEPIAAQEAPAQVLPKTKGFLPPERVCDLRSALSFLDADDYHMWIAVGQALHSTEAVEAFGLWDEWSKTSEKYNASEMRKKWRSFNHHNGLNVESIFSWAGDNGWVNPASAIAQERQKEHDELKELVDARQNQKKYKPVEREDIKYSPLPVKSLENLCNWFNDQLPVYYLQATQACVLSLASTVASRQYVSTAGDPAHAYLSIVSDTVGSLRCLKGLCHRLLAETNQRQMIRSTRITSAQTIYKTLMRSPSSHYVSDDYGQMLAFAKRQPSGLIEQALSVISEVYQARDLYLDPDPGDPIFKDLDNPIIYKPALTMLALLSEDQIPALTRRSELGRGALEQMLVIEAGNMITNDDPELSKPLPSEIAELVEQIRGQQDKGNLSSIQGATLPPDPNFVQIEAEAKSVLQSFDVQLMEMAKQFELIPLGISARTTMRRLMVTLGTWNNPGNPRINVDIAQWSGRYVSQWLGRLMERIELTSTDSGKLDVYERVIERIAKSRSEGITLRDITRGCRPFRNMSSEKRGELISLLIGDAEIVEIETTPLKGRPTLKYYHRSFAEVDK